MRMDKTCQCDDTAKDKKKFLLIIFNHPQFQPIIKFGIYIVAIQPISMAYFVLSPFPPAVCVSGFAFIPLSPLLSNGPIDIPW